MKINEKLINDIINLKVRIKKEEDKIELSYYEDFIPMYDIYTHRIYSVPKEESINYFLMMYKSTKEYSIINNYNTELSQRHLVINENTNPEQNI